jgi:hypothetical protein
MAKQLLYSTICIWLTLFGGQASAQENSPAAGAAGTPATAPEGAPATGPGGAPQAPQPTISETPAQPPEQPAIVPATPYATPGALQAAPDPSGTILPGFGFPFGGAAGLTGTGFIPFSQNTGLITATGILPYERAATASPNLFQADQNVRYDDNVLAVPQGQPAPLGLKKADLIETTRGTISPSMYISEQILFAHATYGFNRYFRDTALDNNFYNTDAGLNWRFGHLCTGTGLAALSQNQVPFRELTSFSVQTNTSKSVIETAKCALSGYLSAIVDSSLLESTNTATNQPGLSGTNVAATAAPSNNFTSRQVRTGLEYSVPGLDTIRATGTFTDREFGNRSAVATPGLASSTNISLYELFYHRDLTPKLKFDGNIGFNQVEIFPLPSGASTPSVSNVSGWSYSATLLYLATPKITIQASTARGLGPPLAVLANFQVTNVTSLSADYRYSPKLTFHAGMSESTTLNSLTSFSSTSGPGINPVGGNLRIRSIDAGVNYRVSPFVNAFATYNYYDKKDNQLGQTTLDNLYLVGLTVRH